MQAKAVRIAEIIARRFQNNTSRSARAGREMGSARYDFPFFGKSPTAMKSLQLACTQAHAVAPNQARTLRFAGMCCARAAAAVEISLTAHFWPQTIGLSTATEEEFMRKWVLVCLAAITLASGSLMAATLQNLSGQSCGDFTGTWHFVNNQTGGAPAGQLTATWSSGDTCTVSASKVLSSTQHFYCTASGTLLGASTNLPGKLVLSDFSCDDTKTPPPCDPKTQICK